MGIFDKKGKEVLDAPDLTLKKERANISLYERLLFDSRVWACINRLVLYMQNYDWRVVTRARRGAVRETRYFEEQFWRYDIVSKHAYSAALVKFFGFGVFEIITENVGGLFVLRELRALPQRWFGFNEQGDLLWFKDFALNPVVLKRADGSVNSLDDMMVVLIQNNATFDNPYGESDASRLYYEVKYRNSARQMRGYVSERYATPTPVVSYPDGLSEEMVREAVNAMRLYMGDGVIAFPKTYDVKSFSNKVDDDVFQRQIDDADRIIQDVILLQSAGQDLRSVGARSAIESFERMTYKGVFAAKRILEHLGSEVMRVLSYLNNFGRDYYMELYDAHEFNATDELERDRRLMEVSGLRFKPEYFIEKYQINTAYIDSNVNTESEGNVGELRSAAE